MIGWILLLAAVASTDPPAGVTPVGEGEYVQEVRIDGDDAGLAEFVSLLPGRALDSEEVRRTVELLYATGKFEDVIVRIERDPGEDGVVVVIQPVPAPLLVDVRVEGDRVVSSGNVRRITGLRRGEPLWEERLDRAGRDVALALAARGYLEALVDPPQAVRVPGGADALFRIRSGPRVRVLMVSISGAEGLAGLSLGDLVRPRQGGVFRREHSEKAAEAMRQRLAAADHWQASVEVREKYIPGAARVSLVFDVSPGPRMDIEIRGADPAGSLVREARQLLREGGAGRDVLEAGAERVESHLRGLGHREVVVNAFVEPGPEAATATVVFEAVPGPRSTVTSVEIRGAGPALVARLKTRPGDPVRDSVLSEDVRTLTRRLQTDGHFDASVEVDVPEGGGAQPVVFYARPGPRAKLVDVVVEGPPLPPTGDDEEPQELASRAGLPYRVSDMAASREVLLSTWRRAGYLDAEVEPVIELSEQQTEVQLRFVVTPGPRTIVENVVVAGLRDTREATVAREIVLRRGEPFSFERVLESQRRLLSLGIFERVTISELDPSRERRRDVVVTVEEAPRTTVAWGVGYSEQDLLRGSVEVTRRNLSGLGRTASVFVRGSFRGSRFLLNLREPWLLGRDLDSFVTAFWEEEDRSTFDYNRKGGVAQVGQELGARTTLIYRYLYQNTRVFNIEVPPEEIDRQFRTYSVSGPAFSVVWDGRDDPLEPRRGAFFASDLGLSLDALGGVPYLRGFFQAASIRRLRADLALVVSGRLGLASTYGDSPPLLPLPERFFAGGAYGPRGWPVDEVGPKVITSEGDVFPTGGNALLLGGVELRYDVFRAFELAAFFDIGNVYPEVRDISIPGLRKSVGLGVRYLTPIGPIRLDYGHKIHRLPESPADAFTSPLDMPSSLLLALALALALVASPAVSDETASPVELVDRILAVVDGRPLLLSEVRAVEATRALDREEALEESIDERLMFQEAARLPQAGVTEEEVRRALEPLVATRPGIADQVPSPELERLLRRQLSILKYIQFRFRPQIRVSDDALRAAWNEDFRGAPEGPAFEEAAPALRERLERLELDQRIEGWVKDLRQRAEVRYVVGPGSPPSAEGPPAGP